jgi:twitching motility protein PilT
MRRKGSLDAIEDEAVLDDAGLRALLRELATPEQWQSYEAESDLDFAYGIPGVARFRANYFAQENGAGAVFRIIPEEIRRSRTWGCRRRSASSRTSTAPCCDGPTGRASRPRSPR